MFTRLADGQALECKYVINGHQYDKGYYLADGMYPTYFTFVKTIHNLVGGAKKNFAKKQESARKDVERAFGVLQARFEVVGYPYLS